MIDYFPKYIEIETSVICNRSCVWCPNHYIVRSKSQKLMQWHLFEKIIGELKSINYSGKIALHNYNEPFLNKRLFNEIEYIKENLPKSRPRIYSNGDLITKEIFQNLIAISDLYLRITLYPELNNQAQEANNLIQKWIEKKELNNFNWQFERHRVGEGAFINFNKAQVQIIMPDILLFNYRGGSVKMNNEYCRNEPCYMTEHSASIDYNGNLKMCCNIIPEIEEHKRYILGNISINSFISLWHSKELNNLRIKQQNSDWSLSPICTKCKHFSEKV